MLYNLHTHTYRCNHADGEDREYIECAIKSGIKVLGISDHCPQFFPNTDYYSHFRMKPELAKEYVESFRTLAKEYEKDIKILVGFETEYYPATYDKLIEFYDGDEKKDDEEDEKLDIKTYIKGKPEEKKSIFGEFEFLDIGQRPSSNRRLMDDEVSINTKNKHKKITFNQKISKEIKKRGGYKYAAILKNKKGDIALILNDEKGVTIQDGGTRENSNVIISNKELVGKVVTFLNITNEYEIAKVTEIEKTNDYVAYILTKIKK